jgi:hypothetical protein
MKQDRMWLKPKEDDSLESIWQYALTVDGYEYAKKRLNTDCGNLANERRDAYWSNGIWKGTFEELRCCLFFEQRRDRMASIEALRGRDLAAIKMLYWTIVVRWYEETAND